MASSYEALLLSQVSYLLNPALVSVRQATTQSITANTWTAVTFDASTVDTYSGHSTVTNNTRYTAQVPGWYWFSGVVCYTNASTTGWRVSMFSVNGTRYQGSQGDIIASGDYTSPVACPTPIFLNVGDYVELVTYSSVTTSTAVLGDLDSRLNAVWVHQ